MPRGWNRFNNGCYYGCATCDGTNSSTGHDDESYKKYVYKGRTKAQLAASNVTASTLAGLWAPKPGDMTIDAKAYPTGGPGGGPCSPKPASRSLRRALLTPQVNSGSCYRCSKRF